MGKITEDKLSLTGDSGDVYEFGVYTLDTEFKAIGGIYIFFKRYIKDSKFRYAPIYCGKTKDLSTRFDDHHKKDEIKKNGANCICVMSVSTETERTEIEKDILAAYNFACNEVNN